MPIYERFIANKAYYEVNSTNVLFSTFYYRGVDIVGNQDEFVEYTSNSLAMNIPNYYFSETTMLYENFDFVSDVYSNQSATCTVPRLVKQLGDALQQNIRAHFICDNRWLFPILYPSQN